MALFSKPQTPQAPRHNRGILLVGLLIGLAFSAGCTAHVKPTTTGESKTDQQSMMHQANVIEASPTWFSCKAATDCTIIEGVCGSAQAVNKDYLQPFFGYRDKMNQSVDCTNKSNEAPGHTAQCLKNRCSLNPPDHQP